MNFYLSNPLYVSIINPIDKKIIQTHYFLGDIPKKLLQSANNYTYNEKKERIEWNVYDQDILKDFYGKNWRNKLIPEDIIIRSHTGTTRYYDYLDHMSNSNSTVIGGKEKGIQLYDNEDLLEALDTDKITIPVQIKPEVKHYDKISKILYHNLSVYPEDNLYDIRLKIQLITNIPIYRQFLIYYADNEFFYTYKVLINKTVYSIDWTNMIDSTTDVVINGLGIDMFCEKNKDTISIQAYDRLVLAEIYKTKYIKKIYVIDLDFFIKEYDLYKITDKYQIDLLYYGFIIKYYPQINIDVFKLLLNNTALSAYPLLSIPNDIVQSNQLIEQELVNYVYSLDMEKIKYNIAITSINILIYPEIIKLNLNLRNLFDLLVLNEKIIAMGINVTYGLRKQLLLSKYYVTVVNDPVYLPTVKNSIVIVVLYDEQTIYITIYKNGEYKISVNWLETENITYDNVLSNITKPINELINEINKLGIYVFSTGGSLNSINKEVIFSTTTLSIFYPCILTLHEFNLMKNSFKQYEKIGIIKIQLTQDNRILALHFFKGIIDKNGINNGYQWLYSDNTKAKRYVKIVHRLDKLQIELINIRNIEEYEIIKKYILAIIYNYITNHKIKHTNKEIVEKSSSKRIKKLKDLDPELFNFEDEHNKPYSVLCQSERQPIIYSQNEIQTLSKVDYNNLIKYWNFTKKSPVYYLCKGKYPYINFITNKHPKNYCVPCCKKLRDIPESRVARINKTCIETRTYNEGEKESDYVMLYGKYLPIGRKSYIPSILKTLLPNFTIIKCQQYSDIRTNIGFISSIKYIFGHNIVQELVNILTNLKKTYYVLADGKASRYKSVNELILDITSIFIHDNSLLLTNINIDFWEHIFTDLIKIKFNIEIAIIVNNLDTFYLNMRSSINYDKNSKLVILLKDEENGLNPVLNEKNESILSIAVLKPIYKYIFQNNNEICSLSFMINFCIKHKYSIEKLYINFKNLCYAIQLNQLILPVTESVIVPGYPLSYDIYPVIKQTTTQLYEIIDKINEYKADSIIVSNYLVNKDNYVIGFESLQNLRYYHTPKMLSIDNYIVVPYDYRDIDKEILTRNFIVNKPKDVLIKQFNQNLYKLFLSEFISIIIREKNTTLRNLIKKVLLPLSKVTNKEIDTIFQQLYDLLREYPEDMLTIEEFINFIYFHTLDLHDLIKFIDHSTFEFDYMTLKKYQEEPDLKKLKSQIMEIMEPHIIIGNIDNIPNYFNTYTSCSKDSTQFFCKGSKLLVPENKIEDMYDVLINDLKNKSKRTILLSSISGIVNYFNFIKRPYEFIHIFEIKELQ